MNTFYNKCTLILIAFALVSCSDDFVDVDPPFQLTSETFFETEDDFRNALRSFASDIHQCDTWRNSI
jgi:hypothetical protein